MRNAINTNKKLRLGLAVMVVAIATAACSDSKKGGGDSTVNPNNTGHICAENPNACVVGEQRTEGIYLASAQNEIDLGNNAQVRINVAFFGSRSTGRSIPVSMRGTLSVKSLNAYSEDDRYKDIDEDLYTLGGGDEDYATDFDLGPVQAPQTYKALPLLGVDGGVWNILTAEEGRWIRDSRQIYDVNGKEQTILGDRVQIKNLKIELVGGSDKALAVFNGTLNLAYKNAKGFNELRGSLTFYRIRGGQFQQIDDLKM